MRVESNCLYPLIQEWSSDLKLLGQIDPLSKSEFYSFCRDRNVGLAMDDSSQFWKSGWLRAEYICIRQKNLSKGRKFQSTFKLDNRVIGDQWNEPDECSTYEPLFHPFRILPALKIINSIETNWTTSSILSDSYIKLLNEHILRIQRAVKEVSWSAIPNYANGIADLAILLEPVYWPCITRISRGIDFYSNKAVRLRDQHRKRMVEVLQKIGLEDLRVIHEELRFLSSAIDNNDSLYILLRASNWQSRSKIQGRIGLALWLRHIAEVIRRGAEEAFDCELLEEDQGFGMWSENGREALYGNRRPLDSPKDSRKHILQIFGLDPSIRARWYVEGDTEAGFIRNLLGNAGNSQVLVVNLEGQLGGSRADKFSKEVQRDIESECFSFISLDKDVPENIKAVKNLAKNELIVGFVSVSDPDFEFHNFTVDELVQAAIQFDKNNPIDSIDSKDLLENADWANVNSAKAFEEKYKEIHENRRRGLKGDRWGELLAELYGNSTFPDGRSRPVQECIMMARRSLSVAHRVQRENYKIDPENFEIVRRS